MLPKNPEKTCRYLLLKTRPSQNDTNYDAEKIQIIYDLSLKSQYLLL